MYLPHISPGAAPEEVHVYDLPTPPYISLYLPISPPHLPHISPGAAPEEVHVYEHKPGVAVLHRGY